MDLFKTFFSKQFLLEIISIVVVGITSLLFYLNLVPLPVLLVATAFGLYSLLKTALIELFKEKKIGTELFISVAVIISVIGKEYLAGSVVLMIILIAEYIASASGERARASIKELIGSVPQTVTLIAEGKESEVPISSIKIGDVVIVKAGEKIPVDGIVLAGSGSANQAPITGESVPVEKTKDSEVFAGTILEMGTIDVKMTKAGNDTVFSRIISLVEEAENSQAPIEKLTDKVASWLIPIVFIFVGAAYFFTRDVKLVIALLIFTSPAELGLATPLVTISAIARAAKEGILVKGGKFLEELAKINTIVFDKTGTLTVGKPTLKKIDILNKKYTENDLLQFAASAENRSSHPLANAIIQKAEENNISLLKISDFEVYKGTGISAKIDDKKVYIGNKALMDNNKVAAEVDSKNLIDTAIYMSIDGEVAAVFYVADEIRPGAKEMIEELKKNGIENIIMLTGDNSQTAKYVSDQLGITSFWSDMLPEDKIKAIEELQAKGKKVAMVGDGINDAPALVQANVGISMGITGTQAAMEAADIVLVEDKLEKIARTIAISKRAFRTIKENIIGGVGFVHVIGIALVLLGILGPVEAAAIHLLPDTLVFLNSIKLLRIKI